MVIVKGRTTLRSSSLLAKLCSFHLPQRGSFVPTTAPVFETSLNDIPSHRRGKVRDMYEVDDYLLMVAIDAEPPTGYPPMTAFWAPPFLIKARS